MQGASQREGGGHPKQGKGTFWVEGVGGITVPSLPLSPFPFHPVGHMSVGLRVGLELPSEEFLLPPAPPLWFEMCGQGPERMLSGRSRLPCCLDRRC